MRAIRQYEFGEADTLRYEDVPDPEPGEGRVRIRAAAGVHLVHTTIRRGGQLGPNPPPTALELVGCLSLEGCRLANPRDEYGERGPGPQRLELSG